MTLNAAPQAFVKRAGATVLAIDWVLEKLSGVTRSGQGFTARCPGHDDRHSSLSIGVGDDGRVLLKCFAGCTAEQIVKSIGLKMADLFEQGEGRGAISPPKTVQPCNTSVPGLTLEQYAAAKGLPLEFLRGLGLTQIHYQSEHAVRMPYYSPDGSEAAIRFRVRLVKSAERDDRFRWKSGAKPSLYGLERLEEVRRAGYVVLVEGESDAQTLWLQEVPALGLPGAANWQESWAQHLDGIPIIYAVIEPDQGGEAMKKWLAKSAIKDRVRLVSLGAHKDPSALYLAAPEQFGESWRTALEAATPWQELAQAEAKAALAQAWSVCAQLARAVDILSLVVATLVRAGVVGEVKLLKLIYLVVTSRFLRRPVSLAVKGPSSGGKSYAVEKVLGLFPAAAFYALTAMSERALAYSEEDLRHRFFVLYEAAGMKGEFASYLVRSLLSEGRVRYETVEKTKDGLRPRLIEREGPTGLVVTTTEVLLHRENETRLLSATVTDTPEQTKQIMRAIASRDQHEEDFAELHALQTWLSGAEHRVTIPYAEALADAIPPLAVRLRRDFGALLGLIEAHAILHQATRKRDADGRVVATLADYAAVRELVADVVAHGLGATVKPIVRETVNTAARLLEDQEEISLIALAKALKLDKSAVSRRVQEAIEWDYLHNLEDRRGRPARLVLGEAMPDDADVLPLPETLEVLHGCSDSEGMATPLPSPYEPVIGRQPELALAGEREEGEL